jgi:5-hydroxyisourate hydrolase
MSLTTQVLDSSRGTPAADIPVTLEFFDGEDWVGLGNGTTDMDGHVEDLSGDGDTAQGTYRLTFDTDVYYAQEGEESFFPYIRIVFRVVDTGEAHHVRLLLSPFGYTTYRGT